MELTCIGCINVVMDAKWEEDDERELRESL